jgi:uncharacterized protein (DUF1697 family)
LETIDLKLYPMGDCWIALLRGINVGTAKRIAMADLRATVQSLGYQDVATLLNSGNVVFRQPKGAKAPPAPAIEQAVAKRLGVSATVIAMPVTALDAILRTNPLAKPSRDPSRLLVAAVRDGAVLGRLAALAKQDWGREELACGPAAGYLWCPDGISAGALFMALNKTLGDGVTMRNWATMSKLQAMTRAPAATVSRPPRRAK